MITTGSDGTPLSAAFAAAVAQPIVGYDAQLWTDGSQLSCTIRRITLALGSVGDSSGSDGVQVGGCWSARMEASLHDCSANVSGSELELRIGVDVGGSYEYVTVATVTVTSAQRSGDELAVLAYGRIATWLSVPLGLSEGDYAASALASSIAQASGTSVTLGAFESTTQTVHVLAGWTCRDALAALATRLGGFAAEGGDGSVLVVPLGGSVTFTVDNMRSLPLLAEADWEADGLTVTPLEGAPYVFGTGRVHVEDDFATQATAAVTWGNLDGAAFRPGTLSVSTLDPRVTPFDVAGVADGQTTLAVPAMGITATYDGGWWGSMSAPGMGEVAEDAAYEGPVLQRVRKAQSEAASAGTAAAAAQQAADDAAEVATSYITELSDGIMVHPDGDSTTGWSIRSALELLKGGTSYLKAWLDGNVPKVRIGLESAAHVLLGSSGMEVFTNASARALKASVDARGRGAISLGTGDTVRLSGNDGQASLMAENGSDLTEITIEASVNDDYGAYIDINADTTNSSLGLRAYDAQTEGLLSIDVVSSTHRVSLSTVDVDDYDISNPDAFREAISAAGVTDQDAQNVNFSTGSGSTDMAIYTNVTNSSSADYGKRVALWVRPNGLALYDSTNSAYEWQITGLSGTTDLSTTTSDPTISNATATTFQLRRCGNVVQLVAYQLKVDAALASGSSVSLGSNIIPSAMRPSEYLYVPIAVNNSSNATGLFLYVTTAGSVTLYNRSGASLATTTNVSASATWIV